MCVISLCGMCHVSPLDEDENEEDDDEKLSEPEEENSKANKTKLTRGEAAKDP